MATTPSKEAKGTVPANRFLKVAELSSTHRAQRNESTLAWHVDRCEPHKPLQRVSIFMEKNRTLGTAPIILHTCSARIDLHR